MRARTAGASLRLPGRPDPGAWLARGTSQPPRDQKTIENSRRLRGRSGRSKYVARTATTSRHSTASAKALPTATSAGSSRSIATDSIATPRGREGTHQATRIASVGASAPAMTETAAGPESSVEASAWERTLAMPATTASAEAIRGTRRVDRGSITHLRSSVLTPPRPPHYSCRVWSDHLTRARMSVRFATWSAWGGKPDRHRTHPAQPALSGDRRADRGSPRERRPAGGRPAAA